MKQQAKHVKLGLWVLVVIGVITLVGWSQVQREPRVDAVNSSRLSVPSSPLPPATSEKGENRISPPGLPSSFYGAATLNGRDAPLGTNVSAWIGDTKYIEQPIVAFEGRSFYAMNLPADDPATVDVEGGRPGDVVTFKIATYVVAQTATWQSGSNAKFDVAAGSQ